MASAHQWVTIGLRLFPLIVGAVHAVESLVTAKSGQEKQDAAVESVRAMLQVIEGSVSKDLLDDSKVQQAVRAMIDAYVTLQNVIAEAKESRREETRRAAPVVEARSIPVSS